jgi:PII-like signaling protein
MDMEMDMEMERNSTVMTFSTMCALRVYLKQGDQHREGGFFRRLFKRPLPTHLLQQALRQGVTHASVHLGHSGFTRGATDVSFDVTDIPMATLPVCLELVAPKPLLEQFVRDHAKSLAGGTLVMLEGVHIAPLLESVSGAAQHHVEYIKAEGVTVPVDHVDLEAAKVTASQKSPDAEAGK